MKWKSIIVFLLFPSAVFASRDSLIKLLSKTKVDTVQFDLYSKLIKNYYFTNRDSSELFANKLFFESSAKNNLKWIGNSYALKGNIFYIHSEFDSAYSNYQISIKYRKKINDTEGISSLYSNLGLIHNEKGEYNQALKKFNYCLKIDLKNKNISGVANDYNNIGISYWNMGEMQKAIDYYHKCISYAEKLNDDYLIAQAYNNIGIIYRQVKNYKESESFHQKSATIFKELNDQRNLASAYGNLGIVYEEQNDFKNAKKYQELALKISIETNDKSGMAIRYNNLGVIYESLKDYNSSIEFHQKSLVLKLEMKDQAGISFSKANIGMLKNKTGKFKEAIQFCNEALLSSREILSPEAEKISCGCLYEAYKLTRNHEKALYYHELEKSLADSLTGNEQARELAQKETAFKFMKIATEDSIKNSEAQKIKDAQIKVQEEQIKREQEELKSERIFNYSLYGGLILVLGFAFIIYNRFKLTRKQKGVIEFQMKITEEQNKEIRDSISYAKRIQEALLKNDVSDKIPFEHFIYYKPKDIISGDFYWISQNEHYWYFGVGDCTGHGVPGALLTMLGVSALNELIGLYGSAQPDFLLNKLRDKFIRELNQTGNLNSTRDGMDVSLCRINTITKKVQWAGANNPLWIYRPVNEQNKINFNAANKTGNFYFHEMKADKQPIGYFEKMSDYSLQETELNNGDLLFIFSDGFADQFGGLNHKKFKSSSLKILLAEFPGNNFTGFPEYLEQHFQIWKGDLEQVDDVCVIGIRI